MAAAFSIVVARLSPSTGNPRRVIAGREKPADFGRREQRTLRDQISGVAVERDDPNVPSAAGRERGIHAEHPTHHRLPGCCEPTKVTYVGTQSDVAHQARNRTTGLTLLGGLIIFISSRRAMSD